MTNKITDLEGRLSAAFKRDRYKTKPLPANVEVLGTFKVAAKPGGLLAHEIILCKIHGEQGFSEFVVWTRTIKGCSNGYYSTFYGEALTTWHHRIAIQDKP